MVSTYTEMEKLCEQIPGLRAKEEKSMYMQAAMNLNLVHCTNDTQTMESMDSASLQPILQKAKT